MVQQIVVGGRGAPLVAGAPRVLLECSTQDGYERGRGAGYCFRPLAVATGGQWSGTGSRGLEMDGRNSAYLLGCADRGGRASLGCALSALGGFPGRALA